jgi:predicted transcriptional regulator
MATKFVPAAEEERVLVAISHAPVVESTPEEMAAFEEGLADIRAGRTVSAEQVRDHVSLVQQGA